MSSFIEGQVIRFSTVFRDINLNVIDPTEVVFAFQVGLAAPTQYTYGIGGQVIKDSVGNYHCDVDTTGLPGSMTGQWASHGTGQAVAAVTVQVQAEPIIPAF